MIGSDQEKIAAVVDPGRNSLGTVVTLLDKEGATLQYILLTHSHWDHIGDVAAIKDKYPSSQILVHKEDEANLINPGADGLPLAMPIEGVKPDGYLKEGQIIKIGDLSCQVIETPGHSRGSVCFYFEAQKVVFTGDTLFKGAIGNTSFPTSEPKKMGKSLQTLFKLPKETVVYPGHGKKTTIGEEKAKRVF